jgi:hypothetical protein
MMATDSLSSGVTMSVRPSDPNDPSDPTMGAQALDRFLAGLAAERAALEPVEFEELARAVDGELEPGEEELWQERLALEPALASRAADLDRFRASLEGAEVVAFRPRPKPVSFAGWWAAAAILLLALGIEWAPRLATRAAELRASRRPAMIEWSHQELFQDGFENGSVAAWSSVAPSG